LGEHGFFDKRFMYEPTLHTPLLMRYKPLSTPGSTTEKMVLNLDYGATFLDLAGVKKPEDVQGESLIPVMKFGDKTKDWRDAIYYHYYEYPGWHSVRKHYGVRSMTHKLIKFYGDDITDYEMYDLKNDPNELINLYDLPEFEGL
jgi:arylsulfatase A-like enzyme